MAHEIILDFDKIPTATLQQKKAAIINGHISMYEPANVKLAIREYEWRLKRHRPAVPIKGPVKVTVCWAFGAKEHRKWGNPKVTRPDLDNMAKMLLDRMTKLGFWEDDSQITDLELKKYWSDRSRIIITYEEVTI